MQQDFSARGKLHGDLPMISTHVNARCGAALKQTVDAFDCAVVSQAKPFGKGRDRRPGVFGQTLQRDQELMRLWLDPFGAGCFLAAVQKTPDKMTKLSSFAKAKLRNISCGRTRFVVILAGNHEMTFHLQA